MRGRLPAVFVLLLSAYMGISGFGSLFLCVVEHHIQLEASTHGHPMSGTHEEPVGEDYGDHCLNISISIGDIQFTVHKLKPTNVRSLTPDIAGAPFHRLALKRNPAKSLYSSDFVGKSYHLSSLSSVILLT